MFSDMWMWEEAKRFAEHTPQIDLSELNRKQALSLERINAWEEAAQMHAASGDYARAIEIFAQHGSLDGLISVARRINLNLGAAGASSSTTVAGAAGVGGDDSKVASSSSSSLSGKTPNSHTLSLSLKDKTELLRQCVKIFIATREFKFAREVLHKLGDIGALVKLYVEQEDWSQAFLLASAHFHEGEAERGFSNSEIYLPYAKWLAMNDRFEESQSAYRLAGQPKQSLRFINQLIMCAVVERRRDDAAYYTWLLGQEGLAALADFNARRGGRGSSGASEAQLLADWDDRRELVMTHRAYVATHSRARWLKALFTFAQRNIAHSSRTLTPSLFLPPAATHSWSAIRWSPAVGATRSASSTRGATSSTRWVASSRCASLRCTLCRRSRRQR